MDAKLMSDCIFWAFTTCPSSAVSHSGKAHLALHGRRPVTTWGLVLFYCDYFDSQVLLSGLSSLHDF